MKTIKFLLILICSSIALLVTGQPAIPGQKSVADSLKDEGDIPGAIAAYRKSYLANPKDTENIYKYSCALSINRQIDSCFKYLYLAVKMDTTINSLIDPDLLTVREDKQWQNYENYVISLINAKFRNPYDDIEYARELWRLRAMDQAFFTEVGIAARKTGFKSSVVEALWKAKFIIQKYNQKDLEKLLDKKGWPRIKDVGREAAMGAYLVIQHSNSELQRKFLPDVKKVCEADELGWERYALMYDRALFNDNKPQKYGTHTMYNEKTGKEELYPLENEKKVNEWRREIGLQPLEEYLKQFNIQYLPNANNK